MANYTISEKTKKISVSATLTPIEQQIIAMYIGQGYTVVEKNNSRLSEKDIINWLEKKKDTKGLEEFKAKKEELITDKNGKQRKGGYLIALKWFKGKYKNATKEIANLKAKVK